MQALTIEHIETAMAGDAISPGQLSDFRVYLAALSSMNTAEIARILDVKPKAWLAIRESKKSDRAADHEWEATTLGMRETQLNMLNKRIEVLSRALSAKLRVMELEAKNLV